MGVRGMRAPSSGYAVTVYRGGGWSLSSLQLSVDLLILFVCTLPPSAAKNAVSLSHPGFVCRVNATPAPVFTVSVMAEGRMALERINKVGALSVAGGKCVLVGG